MDRSEKAARVKALTELFVGYGQEVTAARLEYYGRQTATIPFEVFHQACRNAALQERKGFVPSVGQIVASALDLAPGPMDTGTGQRLKPRWYKAALASPQERRRLMARSQQVERLGDVASAVTKGA